MRRRPWLGHTPSQCRYHHSVFSLRCQHHIQAHSSTTRAPTPPGATSTVLLTQGSLALPSTREGQCSSFARQSTTCFFCGARLLIRQLRRSPLFLAGSGQPGGRPLLSTGAAPPAKPPAASAQCSCGPAYASGGVTPTPLIPASCSPAGALRDPQPAGPTAARTFFRATCLILQARQPAPLQLRGRAASQVIRAPIRAPASRPRAGPSPTQGHARSASSSQI
ncbi:hypothetical protein NDU88_005024 [Pleurodeles waltl]|uniref:Uncharacterized protein n=1 Tax=Pleurodeles waltl TaxID=8319 RepID=A0AAV7UIN4_PLEWA|nr:hypothetical protein NDU88_005024 [Pleurodeles waltl]